MSTPTITNYWPGSFSELINCYLNKCCLKSTETITNSCPGSFPELTKGRDSCPIVVPRGSWSRFRNLPKVCKQNSSLLIVDVPVDHSSWSFLANYGTKNVYSELVHQANATTIQKIGLYMTWGGSQGFFVGIRMWRCKIVGRRDYCPIVGTSGFSCRLNDLDTGTALADRPLFLKFSCSLERQGFIG